MFSTRSIVQSPRLVAGGRATIKTQMKLNNPGIHITVSCYWTHIYEYNFNNVDIDRKSDSRSKIIIF